MNNDKKEGDVPINDDKNNTTTSTKQELQEKRQIKTILYWLKVICFINVLSTIMLLTLIILSSVTYTRIQQSTSMLVKGIYDLPSTLSGNLHKELKILKEDINSFKEVFESLKETTKNLNIKDVYNTLKTKVKAHYDEL